MTHFHAVFIDETGQGEFGVGIEAKDRMSAILELQEQYPESRLVQLESPQDRADRLARIWREAERSMYEEDGEWYPPDYDEDEEEDEL